MKYVQNEKTDIFLRFFVVIDRSKRLRYRKTEFKLFEEWLNYRISTLNFLTFLTFPMRVHQFFLSYSMKNFAFHCQETWFKIYQKKISIPALATFVFILWFKSCFRKKWDVSLKNEFERYGRPDPERPIYDNVQASCSRKHSVTLLLPNPGRKPMLNSLSSSRRRPTGSLTGACIFLSCTL